MSSMLFRTTGLCALLAIAGCVGTDIERAGIGAGIGGAAMLALDASVPAGLVVGAAAGALADDFAR